jgi:hypothetical protein
VAVTTSKEREGVAVTQSNEVIDGKGHGGDDSDGSDSSQGKDHEKNQVGQHAQTT